MDSKKEYLLHLLIINRSGALLYDKQFEEPGLNPLNSNELLMLASTFHAMHAISAHAIPPPHAPIASSAASTSSPNQLSAADQNKLASTSMIYASGGNTGGNSVNLEQIPSHANPRSLNVLLFPEQHLITATSGISTIETKSFKFHCLQTPTGMKYVAATTPNYPDVQSTLKNMSIVYADYALKNPFYELGMPIRSELFDTQLNKVLSPVVNPLKH